MRLGNEAEKVSMEPFGVSWQQDTFNTLVRCRNRFS